jgi:tetratricopeptide (TPR) repeat protein
MIALLLSFVLGWFALAISADNEPPSANSETAPAPAQESPAERLVRELESRELVDPADVIPGFESQAVVVLAYFDQQQTGSMLTAPRVAFAVGDGTLLLTAAHCVTDLGKSSKTAASANRLLISPYYGDVFDFEIVALDKKADVAVLKASWPHHPGLHLANEEELARATELVVTGYPPREGKELSPILRDIRGERLPIVSWDESEPSIAIRLRSTRYVRPGWSGSALVVPETGKVAGVATILSTGKTPEGQLLKRDAAGCSIRSINALLRQSGLYEAAHLERSALPPIEHAQDSFHLAMDYINALLSGQEAILRVPTARALAQLRPTSPFVQLFVAWSATEAYQMDSDRENLLDLAESAYLNALQLAPEKATVHAGYANFLENQSRVEEALKATEKTLEIDPDNELAAVNRLHLLGEKDPGKAEALGWRLVEDHPDNAHFWYSLSDVLGRLDKYDESLRAAEKAVALAPDGTFDRGLAVALVGVGRLDEAEPLFAQRADECGCQVCLVKYADFLLDHRPKKLEVAERMVGRAEEARPAHVSSKNINMLRVKFEIAKVYALEEKSPEEAEAHLQKLLEASPENDYYWFILADIQRTLGKYEEAVKAVRKAVALRPDRSYRPRLANVLGKTGRLKEAEEIYDAILREYPDRAKYWFWYATFLNEHCPARTDEALAALSKAEAENMSWPVDAEELAELRERLEAQSIPTSPASQPAVKMSE